LSVVLDMHEDIYGEGFGFDGAPRWACDAARYAAFMPTTPWFLNALDPNVEACVDDFYTHADVQARFVAAWRHVAERLAGAPAVIGFDALNEPAWGSYAIFDFEQDRLEPLYIKVTQAVRAAAPHWVAFLEPGASRNQGIATGLTKFPFGDVVYAPHSYDAGAEGGGGFDPSHRAAILSNLARLAGEARALDAALWIGEYGGDPAAPGIVEYMSAQYDGAGAAAAGSMYWAYDRGGGYSLLAADGSERPLLDDTIARPYPERVAGDPVGWTWDAATSTFAFTYAPDRSLKSSTDFSVPQRRYPKGYGVECGGCAVDVGTPGVLRLLSPPTGASPVTVTLHPLP
jgi:endoglycosylceramidase